MVVIDNIQFVLLWYDHHKTIKSAESIVRDHSVDRH
jgi:hypothetical protein